MIYTKLELVNEVLSVVGLLRLSAQDDLHPDYTEASETLDRVNKRVQARGLWFNRSYPTLIQTIAGEVIIPSNAISVDPVNAADNNIVVRGGKLYDKQSRSTVIGKDVQVRLVELIDIEDLPPTAQMFVLAAARLQFHSDKDGEQAKKADLDKEYARAYAEFHSDLLDHEDLNILESEAMLQFKYSPSTRAGFSLRHGSS